MNINDLPEKHRDGAREYKGRIYRVIKRNKLFCIEEYRKSFLTLWLFRSWRTWEDGWGEYSTIWFDKQDKMLSIYKKKIDDQIAWSRPEIIKPLTQDEELIKDVVE